MAPRKPFPSNDHRGPCIDYTDALLRESWQLSVLHPATMLPGQTVRMVGDRCADVTTCANCGPCVGVLVSPGIIQCYGVVCGVYTGLVPGDIYVVGPDGFPARSPPAPPPFYLQKIGTALALDVLLLLPSTEIYRVTE